MPSVETEILNRGLYRNIKSGAKYNSLIPATFCDTEFSGNGDTYFSVDIIAEMINEYSWQLQKVAKQLQTSSLAEDMYKIQEFAYWHFQYAGDEEDQQLRSPACSWYARKEGIDCKSYSIIAGCLLREMGYNFFIRQIKQPGYEPEYFTHVYIVVPANQSTKTLNEGDEYYVIDGTINPPYEDFTFKEDKYMSGLPHYRLNAPRALGFSFSDIASGAVSLLSCSDKNSAYDSADLDNDIAAISALVDGIVGSINSAVSLGTMSVLAAEVAKYKAYTKLFYDTFSAKKSEGYNKCSTANLSAIIEVASQYLNAGTAGLDAWLTKYFTKGAASGTYTISSVQIIDSLWAGHVKPYPEVTVTVYTYSVKTTPIPQLNIGDYIENILKGTQTANASVFLSWLEQAAGIVDTVTGSVSVIPAGTTSTDNVIVDTPSDSANNTTTLKIVGYTLMGGAAIWGGIEALKYFKTKKVA